MNVKTLGFITGLFLFFLIISLPTFTQFSSIAQHQDARSMQLVIAVFALMAIWWITEAIPIPATALLPAILFPLLKVTGTQGNALYEFNFKNTLFSYANPVIFLFLGGFLIAGAMQKWKLDRRLILWILTRGNLAGNSHTILLSIMAMTAFLSMWISNTATAAMMLPLGLGIISLTGAEPGKSRFGTAIMLGIAWAASIGGVGTTIGTPPNGIALGILNTTLGNDPSYVRITFLDWMKFGVPYVCLFVPVAWYVLKKTFPPEVKNIQGGKEQLIAEKNKLGSLSPGEKRTIIVASLAVILWITNPFWEILLPPTFAKQLEWIDEYTIGLFCGVLLFIIPVNFKEKVFVLHWRDTKIIDWGTLILFGGGIALSEAMFKTGLASWIATSFVGLFGVPSTFLLVVIIILLVDFLSEVTSNTAVTSMMVPIVISIAISTGGNPITSAIAAAVAASMGFMLPIATPPNALVYGTGYVKLKDMIRAGFILDIVGWILTTFVLVVIGSWIFGIISF